MSVNKLFEGKVRAIYEADEKTLLIVTSDRVSAYDVIMPTEIPGKGRILNGISEFWFDYTKDIIPNHFITNDVSLYPGKYKNMSGLEGRSMLVKKLRMAPIECIVRGYISGSAWESYRESGTVCGMKIRSGMQESEQFDRPIFTPSTKAEEGHDINISFEDMKNMIGEELATILRDKTIAVYKKCAEYAKSRGIIIADTKFEFGLDENDALILGDEVLTPDSSRFWPASEYEIGRGQKSYDKQFLRDWLTANGLRGKEAVLPDEVVNVTRQKYADIYEIITGKKFI